MMVVTALCSLARLRDVAYGEGGRGGHGAPGNRQSTRRGEAEVGATGRLAHRTGTVGDSTQLPLLVSPSFLPI